MSIRRFSTLACSAVFLLAGVFPHAAVGQANVNESLETVFLYVDGTNGSDSNPGTQAAPFKTVGKGLSVAVANNRQGIGTRVTVNPGIYREALSASTNSKSTTLPITIQAATNNTVVVSGADVWTGWQPYSANPLIYTNAWPYAWGLCPRASSGPAEQAINLRREMIFVNNVMLTQVLALNQMAPGTFFVDETGGTVYIYPSATTNIATATVEAGTRAQLFTGYSLSNFVVRGMRFEQGNACRYNDAVMFNNANNVLFEADGFNRNNAGGFGINASQNFTIRISTANHNGERGFKSNATKNGVWVNDTANYDNWRGAQGGIYGWAGGGFYFYSQHGSTLQNIRTFFNPSHGVHWDTDNRDIIAKSFVSAYNLRTGLVLEKAQGPFTLANSSVCFNSPLLGFTDGGMVLRTSTYVTLTGNAFANNYVGQLPLIGVQGGTPTSPFTDFETGQVYNLLNENLTMRSNTIVGGAGEQLFYDFDQAGAAWTDLVSSLTSDNNTYWNGSVAQPFTVPVPNWFTSIDWPTFTSMTGQDAHSTFAPPTTDPTIPCQVSPDAPDFWFISYETGSVNALPGVPAKFDMFLIPLGNFKGKITVSAFGLDQIPGGATGSWSKTQLTNSGTTTFTVTTSSSTPVGMYPVMMEATVGSVTRTSTAWLNVQ